jgi:hypothetical protein
MKLRTIMLVMSCVACAATGLAFNASEYEEPGGSSFTWLVNPEDKIYGVSFGSGTWLRRTPVFGEFSFGFFSNGIEDSWYSAAGMSFRLMPHWRYAPFAGGGGSYNYSFSGEDDGEEPVILDERELYERGKSYWAYHAEAGIRMWFRGRSNMLELMARYTWPSLEGDHEYWFAGIGTGGGF